MRIHFIRSSPIQAGITAALIFVLPLLGSRGLGSAARWLGALSAWLMLVSQPPVDPKAMWSRGGRDRWSAAGIFGSMIATQLAGVVEYRLSGGLVALEATTALSVGVASVVAGFAIRLWSIATLGRFFTATVVVAGDQRVVRKGPYAWVRHPSYTGALLIAIGMLLMMRSGVGIGLLVLTVLPAYVHRIRIEEGALIGELGEAYTNYRGEVSAIIPRFFGARRMREV